jgi:hypothetical protein
VLIAKRWPETEGLPVAFWFGPFGREAVASGRWAVRPSSNFSHLTALRCHLSKKPPSQPPHWRTRSVHVLFDTCCPRLWQFEPPRVQQCPQLQNSCTAAKPAQIGLTHQAVAHVREWNLSTLHPLPLDLYPETPSRTG